MDRKGKWGSFVQSEFRSWPLNRLALQRWAALTMIYGRNTIHCCHELVSSGVDSARTHAQIHTDRHSQASAQTQPSYTHAQTQSSGSGRANSIFLSIRQIQFSSRTYVSWLKQPRKTGEICHNLQDWTHYWVQLWQWDAYSCSSLTKSMLLSLMTFLRPSWCHHASHFFLFPHTTSPLSPLRLSVLHYTMTSMVWLLSLNATLCIS